MSEPVLHKLSGVLDLTSLLLIALVALALGAGLTAASLLVRGLAPSVAASLDQSLSRRSGRARLLMGIVNGPALFLVAVLLVKSGWKALGLLALLTLVTAVVTGLVAELPPLGRRLFPDSGDGAAAARAGVVLSVTFLLPVAGQALLALLLLRSIGTAAYWAGERAF